MTQQMKPNILKNITKENILCSGMKVLVEEMRIKDSEKASEREGEGKEFQSE